YIRNFAPDRWPMGSPKSATDKELPPTRDMESNTYVAYADMDASPTKAVLIEHRDDPKRKWQYDFAFGKRPAEELYDLNNDPQQIHNVANDISYAGNKKQQSD